MALMSKKQWQRRLLSECPLVHVARIDATTPAARPCYLLRASMHTSNGKPLIAPFNELLHPRLPAAVLRSSFHHQYRHLTSDSGKSKKGPPSETELRRHAQPMQHLGTSLDGKVSQSHTTRGPDFTMSTDTDGPLHPAEKLGEPGAGPTQSSAPHPRPDHPQRESGSEGTVLLGMVVLAVGGYMGYRFMKKHKKEEEVLIVKKEPLKVQK